MRETSRPCTNLPWRGGYIALYFDLGVLILLLESKTYLRIFHVRLLNSLTVVTVCKVLNPSFEHHPLPKSSPFPLRKQPNFMFLRFS